MIRRFVFSLLFALAIAPQSFAGIENWPAGVSYTYDGAGNIKTIGSNVYVYDTAGRLISGTVGGLSNKQQFEYDAFGNRTNATRTGALCMGNIACEESAPVDPQTNRLGPRSDIAYNQEGDLTAIDVSYSYSFDALGSMTSQSDTHGTREYVYTADGERIGVYNGGWNWTVRDLGGHVLREYTSTGTLGTTNWKWRRDHIYRGALLLASVNQTYDANDQPVTSSYKIFRFHLDHLGTPRIATDATGAVAGEHAYYPFGAEMIASPTESPRDPFRFTGHERDDLGDIHSLDYMHARYFSASFGRFLSVDPTWDSADLQRPQAWNRYSYTRNSTIGNSDPDGKVCVPCAAVGALAAVSYESYRQVRSGEPVNNRRLLAAVGIGAAAGLTGGAIVQAAPTVYSTILANPGAVATGTTLVVGALTPGPESPLGAEIGATGKIGEDALKTLGGESQAFFKTSRGARFVDQLVNGVAHESKVGYQSLTKSIATQIAKDAELLKTKQVRSVVWHFFVSPVTGKGGPSAPLAHELLEKGIQFVIDVATK